ncbi:hypothetical protein [Clostridium sp. SM-530-WT-3G]|uniref:hypothetical protein n=1 Tax=Clostridium sp. SM-530-WT-3G TaxID=2725303 RepID=UPI00145E64C2|nr:hypothetical protein [Clostridium sp. SM-530-WT-3G]NME82361.1 hypothetical protein [Clostridium sp. SM-530-WT-3G]
MKMEISTNGAIGVCGALLGEGVFLTLYVEKETGKVFYYSEYDNKVKMIHGIRLTDAKMDVDENIILDNIMKLKYGEGVIGAIFSEEYAIMITSDCTAEKRNYENLHEYAKFEDIFEIMIEC